MLRPVSRGDVPSRLARTRYLWFLLAMLVVAPGGAGATAAGGRAAAPRVNLLSGVLPTAVDVYGPDCEVTGSRFWGFGGNQDWSPVTNRVAYNAIGANGRYQVFTSDPDGNNVYCVTCADASNGPRADRNKFNPAWDPTGHYLVMEVEYQYHPFVWKNTAPYVQEEILNGTWTDLWVTDAIGSVWFRLTNTRTEGVYGVLDPVWSRDGSKLFWSVLETGLSLQNSFGVWQLRLANFTMTDGVAQLTNVKNITPPGGRFFESHAFSPDDSSVVFTSDLGKPGSWYQNIWSMDLETGTVTKISDGGRWNEHAEFSQDGQRLTYMSTEPYPRTFYRADLLMVDTTGAQKAQLTFFNMPGHVESAAYPAMVTRAKWSADGTRLLVTLQRGDTYPNREMWMLTFAGKCGS